MDYNRLVDKISKLQFLTGDLLTCARMDIPFTEDQIKQFFQQVKLVEQGLTDKKNKVKVV